MNDDKNIPTAPTPAAGTAVTRPRLTQKLLATIHCGHRVLELRAPRRPDTCSADMFIVWSTIKRPDIELDALCSLRRSEMRQLRGVLDAWLGESERTSRQHEPQPPPAPPAAPRTAGRARRHQSEERIPGRPPSSWQAVMQPAPKGDVGEQ